MWILLLAFLKRIGGSNYFNVVKKFTRNKYKKNERCIINYFELKNMGFFNNISRGAAAASASS